MENYKRRLTTHTPPKSTERPEKKHCKNRLATACPARRSLTFSCSSLTKKKTNSPVKYHNWSYDEERALVEFTSIARTDPTYSWYKNEVEWPSFRQDHKFWEDAAKHIRESTGANFLLTNNRVRCRLLNKIRQQYKTLLEAEEYYNLADVFQELEIVPNIPQESQKCRGVNKTTQTREESVTDFQEPEIDVLTHISKLVNGMDENDLLLLTNQLFCQLCGIRRIDSNPGDFISLSLIAMKFLQDNGKSNLIYKFAYGLAKKRPGSEDSLFPINRMPFGLVAYQIDFFSCTNIQQISVPGDFALWHETLCAEFPTRFNRIFRGPMWSSVPVNQQKDPLKALVNVACPSTRTVQKRANKSSEFSDKPELQVASLKKMKEAHPKGRFWIKVDACDIKPALQESTKGEWNGDCLSNNLEDLRASYKKRQSLLIFRDEDKRDKVKSSICALSNYIKSDITFLAVGLQNADTNYTAKFNMPTTSKETLKSLCWERVEYDTLLQQAHCLKGTLEMLLSNLSTESSARTSDVIAAMKVAKPDFLKYFRNIYVKRRQPAATHILVFLISEER